jgi:hypothetical protein
VSARIALVPLCFALACEAPRPIAEGEGEGGEGEEGEGEGEEGEGEGDPRVDVPDVACVVVDVDGDPNAVPRPGALVRARAGLPVARAEGSVRVSVIDDDTVAFVAARVGDVVFGDDGDACVVHVAAFEGLTVELSWLEPNHDVDVVLAAPDARGAYCVEGIVEVDVGVAVDGIDCDVGRCSFDTCNPAGVYLVDFNGDGASGDGDPVVLGDADGPGVEHIVWAAPQGAVLASAHSYDNGPSFVTLRAFLDDALIGEARTSLEANESGAALLFDFDDGGRCVGDATVAGSCAAQPFACSPACADCFVADGGCRACECGASTLGCDHVTNACHVACRDVVDGVDVDDGFVLGAGSFDNDVCPGDVDEFVIDAVAFDDVIVQVFPPDRIDAELRDGEGVLDVGAFAVRGVVRAPPVTLTLRNARQLTGEGLGSVRVEIDAVADRCAVDDEFEPDEGAPRAGTTRGDGVLCPATDLDCIAVTPAEDREFFLDRVSDVEADCLLDGIASSACLPEGARIGVNAGESKTLCVRDLRGRLGTEWHIRSTQ